MSVTTSPAAIQATQTAELGYAPISSNFGSAVGIGSGVSVVGAPGTSSAYFYATFTPEPANDDSTNSQNGLLSPGATAGVVIGVLGGLGIAATAVYFIFFKQAATSSALMASVSPMKLDPAL